MIGIVIVSHSARLAEGIRELAAQVSQESVRLATAGGTDDADHPLGTDAFKVLQAIESVYDDDGVLVFMDLGSAVLSAETALELLDESKRARVHLCGAPVVEGAVAAAAQAAAGAGVNEILRDAERAAPVEAPPTDALTSLATVTNPQGLHARPAARMVRLARRFQARISVENVTRGAEPVDAGGISGLLGLGARKGHQLRIRCEGPEAEQALAAVLRFVEEGYGEGPEVSVTDRGIPAPEHPSPHDGAIRGLAASAGIAMGPLAKLHRERATETGSRHVDDPPAEWERLRAALRGVREEIRGLASWARAHTGENEAGIFDAQLLVLEDSELTARVSHLVMEQRLSAETAWQSVTDELAARIGALEDSYLASRAVDITDVAERVLDKLSGAGTAAPVLHRPSILTARDLTPSEVQHLDPAVVLGLCLEMGSSSAHSIILARAMGIPAVVGLGPQLAALPEGTMVALDGEKGAVWVSPPADLADALEAARGTWLAARTSARLQRSLPARTHNGERIRVLANISSVAEAAEALDQGADGVGVLRTEFLFLDRATPPDEEEQYNAYRTIAEVMGDRPLVIRTLDIGGDKPVPYIDAGEEANPFLGWRGIRLTLARQDLLRTQIRAILRAAAGHNVEILLPMVSSLEEVRQVRAIIREQVPFQSDVPLGVMIEVPAAAAVADQLAREASFFSIGTNDLVQYAMAADRTNPRVAPLADPFQPAVLRMINQVLQAGKQAGIGVTLCGELAADPLATPLLIGMGLREFSVSAKLIPELKRAVARTETTAAENISRIALTLESAPAIRELLAANS